MMNTPEGGGALRRRFRRRFPPPIFSGGSLLTLCFVVLCFSAASFREIPGDLFIGVFRSRRSRWTKDRRPRSSEGEKSWAHAARYFRPRGTLPFPACWASGLQFKPIAFVSKILNRALWPCPFWCPEAPGKSETLKKTFSGKTGLIPNKWENYEIFPKSL